MKRVGEREDPIWKKFIENKKPDTDGSGVPINNETWQVPAAIGAGAIALGAISDVKTLQDGDEEIKAHKGDRKNKKIEHN